VVRGSTDDAQRTKSAARRRHADQRGGAAIGNVELEVAGQRLVASITVEAIHELGLAEGRSVTAIIKASDVMLAVDDE
jgi:molybdopterin-binding protein